MKRAKFSGMINNLFLLRYVIDFSDCSPAEAARKGKRELATSGGDGGARIEGKV
jgi:hypothetical protein